MFKLLIVCNWSLNDGHKKKFSKNKLKSTGYMKGCLDFCVTILLISSNNCRLIYENKSYYNGN